MHSSPFLGSEISRTFKEFYIDLHPDWTMCGNGKTLDKDTWNDLNDEMIHHMKKEYMHWAEYFKWNVSL